MVNDIINAISIKLNSVFGDRYSIYSENMEQGLTEPCFFIKYLTTTTKSYLGKRKRHSYSFDIHYFPEAGNEEMLNVAENMLEALEWITLLNGDILRGLSLQSEIVDDVLHVSVSYPVMLTVAGTGEPMESAAVSVRTEG